ncbi:MAG: DNA-directed RNA polymerase subunit omega [Pseudothermotoga sp.]
MKRMSKPVIDYDYLSKRIPYKYAVPIAVAKRAEALKEYAKPYVTAPDGNLVSIAFKELQEGYIRIRNEEILKILLPEVR